MSSKPERQEAIELTAIMLNALLGGAIPGRTSFELRRLVGDVRANIVNYIDGGMLGTELLGCFDEAVVAGASVDSMDRVRIAMLDEQPVSNYATVVQLTGVVLSLAEQCKIITGMTFVSRSDVAIMKNRMAATIDEIKLAMSEILDGIDYWYTTSLSASLMQHLAYTELKVPRIVAYDMRVNLPTLTVAHKLYYTDTDRSDELIAENKTVHPAFMQRQIVALSE